MSYVAFDSVSYDSTMVMRDYKVFLEPDPGTQGMS